LGTVESVDLDEMRWVMDVNVYGIIRTTQAALPALRHGRHPAIVNVASLAGIRGYRNRVAYGATKGAVVAMTRMMAADLIADGIRVNAVCPGSTETPWVEAFQRAAPNPAAFRQSMEAMIPLGRLGTAEELAEAICFLASPKAGYFHGAIIPIDGGVSSLWVPQG
jgi:NAD(P)-dependent dehydrogenase (short-subunit alcohol dehydrogenase family)